MKVGMNIVVVLFDGNVVYFDNLSSVLFVKNSDYKVLRILN